MCCWGLVCIYFFQCFKVIIVIDLNLYSFNIRHSSMTKVIKLEVTGQFDHSLILYHLAGCTYVTCSKFAANEVFP